MNWIPAILAIGALIVVHEAGHYVVARLCKMRVERFSIGFGPKLLGWKSKKTGTQFQLAPIPFGGFVEIRGMNIVEEVDPNDASAFPNRPVWQRFLTIFAGPATNYLFAVILAFVLFMGAGMLSDQPPPQPHHVMELVKGSASDGKILPGDDIVAIDGQPLTPDKGVPELVTAKKGAPVTVQVRRDGALVDVPITPSLENQPLLLEGWEQYTKNPDVLAGLAAAHEKAKVWRLGVTLRGERIPRVKVGVGTAAYQAIIYPARQTKAILVGLYEWITGKQEGRVSSVVGITNDVKQAIESGWIDAVLLLMVLNVYLGMFNLFPLPALDGGRLVFLVYEMITRRRANPKFETTVHLVGVLVFAVLLVVVTVNDVRHL